MQGEIASKWCRENLNELAAEKELRTTRKGTFLIWRGRSPVDLYLSYIDSDGLSHHLPIKQLGRLFFLEGNRFNSLPDLVVHHLTMREFSRNRVKIINSHKREKLEATHIALADMAQVPGQPMFNVRRGDLLSEMGRIDDRWLLAKHLPSQSIAFFDLTQTSILSDMDAAPDALPYFHDCASDDQDEVVQLLADGGRGSFLLRRSRQTTGAFALLVHTGEKIDKFLVEEVKGVSPTAARNNNNNLLSSSGADAKSSCAGTASLPSSSSPSSGCSGWRLSGRVFASISHIVHRYSIRPMQAEACLTHAVLAPPPPRDGDGKEFCSTDCSSPSTSSGATTTTNSSVEETNGGEGQEEDRVADRVIVATVNAQYKSREDKEWRRCAVTLYEHIGTAMLRIGDTPRADRHTLILHHTELVCLHESIFGREATVFLSPLQNESGIFISFEPLHFYYTWFHLLRRYTVQRRVDGACSSSSMSFYAGASSERMEMSLLSVHVDKYKGDILKAETPYRVGIALNGVNVATTVGQTPATASSVVFDAHFLIVVTSWSCSIQLTLHAAGKSRPTAVSSIMGGMAASLSASAAAAASAMTSSAASAAATASGAATAVERKTSSTTPAMPFAVTTTRQRVVVLTRDAYTPLIDCLMTEVLPVVEWASGRLHTPQRNLLCSVLVSLVWPHSLRALIENTLGKSIEETSGENMLRQDSFASCLITAALRMSGKTLLEARLNEERPKVLTEDWLVSLLSDVAALPSVSLVLACVSATVAAHLPAADAANRGGGREHVVRRAISAAFVLRFANPLIIGALPSTEGPQLARALQTAANAAAMANFCRDSSGAGTATRIFDLFERVRDSTQQTVLVEAYDTAPEQCALLCHLLALALTSCPGAYSPANSSICSSYTSSSTVTSSSATTSSSMTSSTSLPATSSTSGGDGAPAPGLSISMSAVSSAVPTSHNHHHTHPELSPFLARLLELHRN